MRHTNTNNTGNHLFNNTHTRLAACVDKKVKMKKQVTIYNALNLTGIQFDTGRVFWHDTNLNACGSTRNGEGYEVADRYIMNEEKDVTNIRRA